jgi:hypothetical protein
VAVIGVIDDELRAGLVVHRVRESAVQVDALVSLARNQGFPFLDLTRADGMPLSVRTSEVRRVWADAEVSALARQ